MATGEKILDYFEVLQLLRNFLYPVRPHKTINFLYLHFILGQSSSLVKAYSPESWAFYSLLALSSNNALIFKSSETEGIGQVEEDRVGGGEAVSDEIEEAKNDHDRVNLTREHLGKGWKVDYYWYDQHLY